MRESWNTRITRAEHLAAAAGPEAPLLAFYATVLRLQAELYEHIRAHHPSGMLQNDLPILRPRVPRVLEAIADSGPQALASRARRLLASGEPAIDEMLLSFWRAPSDREFFAKTLLQPYARCLADAGIAPHDRTLSHDPRRCPFCGGAPQLSILASVDFAADGGARQLQCATCLGTWPYRRVLCASCGEEDERKLAYYQSPAFDHLRVEACDTCRRYLKAVDRTRLGLAVPLVDEVAGAALDIWAREHGYDKIELNVVGL